jgi:hypothetical protein
MRIGGSKPQEFIQTLAKLVEVGYFEPLGAWSIKIGEFDKSSCDVEVNMDDWRVRNYSTSLALTLLDGTSIGQATLEFTAPYTKLIKSTTDTDLTFESEDAKPR